jgi:UDP-N-acetylglucosamine/UDP-N-acetylgalactosamine diphosphorylase
MLLIVAEHWTCLDNSTPKGYYDIGLPSEKSVFQYRAEGIVRLQLVAQEETCKLVGSVVVLWCIMTNGSTRSLGSSPNT